jgi:cytoskeletal protein CcmA (bactofilin family)
MADNVKISQLNELLSGSLRDATIFPVVDGGSTQKASFTSLKAYLGDTFATDAELSAQISNVNSTIDGLSTTDIDEGSNLYYTNARVNTVINGYTIISGAAQIEDLGFISTGTNIGALNNFTGSYYEDSASFAERILAVSASGGDTIPEGTVSSSQQITNLGFVQTSTINSPFIAERLPINIVSSSAQLEELIAINGGTGVTVTSGSGNQISIEITADGGGGGGGVEYDSEYEIISQSNITNESNASLDGMLLRSGDETTFANFSASVAAGGGGGGGSTDYISNVNNTAEAHTISFTGIGSAFSGDVNLPDGIISSSTQIEDLGFSSAAQNIRVDGLQAYTASLKSVGLISGSGQITELGFISESAASSVPQGTISGSQQISDLGFISGAAGITSSAGVILAEADNTGFDTSFVQENVAYLYYTDARVETHLGTIGLLTGSQGLASGSVTSSAQIIYGEIRNIPKFWGDGVTISSGSSGDTANYIQITATGAGGGTLSAEFYSFTASYELEKLNFVSSSAQIEALGFDPNAGEVVTLNAWTGSGGEFGIFSQSVKNAIENLETGSLTDDFNELLEKDLFSSSLQVGYELLSDKPNFVAGPNITINISGSTFGNTFEISGSEVSGDFTTLANVPEGLISQSSQISELGYATTAYADGVGATTSQSLESSFNGIKADISAIQSDYANLGSNIFTGSQVIQNLITTDEIYVTGSLSIGVGGKITTSNESPSDIIQMTGSFKVTGSIEADEFIVGSAGTPSITSATNIEISASADINMVAQEVNITDVLSLTPRTTTPVSPSSGSFIVSGSGATIKPFFWDGNEWQEISFV